jgi:GDP-D-mannose 3', 5'-epimerase
MNKTDGILIAGGGGFIGGWLVRSLHNQGFTNVRVVDIKPLDRWYQVFADYDNQVMDLQDANACKVAVQGMKYIYNMAADMGGMGFHRATQGRVYVVSANQHQPATSCQG